MKTPRNLFLLFLVMLFTLYICYEIAHSDAHNAATTLKADLDGALTIDSANTELYHIPAVHIDGRDIPSTYLHVVNLPHDVKCTRTLYTSEGYRCSRIVE